MPVSVNLLPDAFVKANEPFVGHAFETWTAQLAGLDQFQPSCHSVNVISDVGRRGLGGGTSEAEVQLLERNAVNRNRLVVGAPQTRVPKRPSDFKGFDLETS